MHTFIWVHIKAHDCYGHALVWLSYYIISMIEANFEPMTRVKSINCNIKIQFHILSCYIVCMQTCTNNHACRQSECCCFSLAHQICTWSPCFIVTSYSSIGQGTMVWGPGAQQWGLPHLCSNWGIAPIQKHVWCTVYFTTFQCIARPTTTLESKACKRRYGTCSIAPMLTHITGVQIRVY